MPHAWSTGIIKAASLHVLAAAPEAEYLEYCVQTTALISGSCRSGSRFATDMWMCRQAPDLGSSSTRPSFEACLTNTAKD